MCEQVGGNGAIDFIASDHPSKDWRQRKRLQAGAA
jgi:hypothetical protein